MTEEQLEQAFRQYVETAFWSTSPLAETEDEFDDSSTLTDRNYELEDLALESRVAMLRELQDFFDSLEADGLLAPALEAYGGSCPHGGACTYGCGESSPHASIAHDFWLTRNGHGAGFWDRGFGELGTKLTEASKPYGEQHFYVDNGVVHHDG